ncbi:unnamed protein product [Alopecurus aequalis]
MAANTPTTTTGSSGGQAQPQMHKELLNAALSGESAKMKVLASRNLDILLETTLQGSTCLHISSSHGHHAFCTDVVELKDSLLEIVNSDEETPLLTAVTNGYIPLASSLLQLCSQPRFTQAILQQDRYGFNALHHAIRNGHEKFALELIAKEPALSQAVSKCNESPMFFAAMRNFTQVCEKLLETPSCAFSGGKHDRNCLHAAVKNCNRDIVKLIMEKRPVLARETDRDKRTPVRHAVLDGKIDKLRVMLEYDPTLGYDINSNGYPLLNDAAYEGQVASAREILKYCPDAPYSNTKGQTLLHAAVKYDHPEFVEFVLKTPLLRKLVNVQDNRGKTALHLAVQKYNPRVVVALLSHEDIDATLLDNDGLSAAWELLYNNKNAKTLNWNEVIMLMSKAIPQEADSLHNLRMGAKQKTTEISRKDAKSLTQIYTTNTSLVAILITTITFAAAFTLPGGYSSAPGSEGRPVMFGKAAFKAFLISDVLAMCSSFAVAFICIIARWEDYEFLIYYRSFTKKLMWFAYMATTTAFSTGLYTVLAPRLHWLAVAICVLVALFPIITWVLGEWHVMKLRYRLGKSFNSDLLDMV